MSEEEEEEEGVPSQAEKKQELLQFVNNCVVFLSFPIFTPKQQQMQVAGWVYHLLA